MSAPKLPDVADDEAFDELCATIATAYRGWLSEVTPLWTALIELGRLYAEATSPGRCRAQAEQIDHETDEGRRIAAAALRMGAARAEFVRAATRHHAYIEVPCRRCGGENPAGCFRCQGSGSRCGVCGSTADYPLHEAQP